MSEQNMNEKKKDGISKLKIAVALIVAIVLLRIVVVNVLGFIDKVEKSSHYVPANSADK